MRGVLNTNHVVAGFSSRFRFERGLKPAVTLPRAVVCVFVSSLVCTSAFAQTRRLEPTDKVQMVQSKDSSNVPLFRIRLSAPEGIPKLKSRRPEIGPVDSIDVLEGATTYKPFYVKLGHEALGFSGAANTSRFALPVMDSSGSMLERLASGQTKFEAAKAAAKQFLNGFQPGVDNIAVVPFESRQVEARIRQAVFASDVHSVEAQIDN